MKEPSDKLLSHFVTIGDQERAKADGHPVDITDARLRFANSVKYYRAKLHQDSGWRPHKHILIDAVFGTQYMDAEAAAELQAFLEAL